ncbi:MAG: helix-turn-helix domain-containing protein [Ginsengibacter sp.]
MKSANSNILEKSLSPLDIDLKTMFEDKLQEYDISKTKLLNLLNIDTRTFDDLINGTSPQPNLVNVIKIADFLNLQVEDVIPTIIRNQPVENFRSIQRATKLSFLAENFDIKKLTKVGFIKDDDDVDYITLKILSFYGFADIKEFVKHIPFALYSKTKRRFSDKMKNFWVASAFQCFKSIENPYEYDREELKDIITKIKPYCQDVQDGLLTVCKALYNVGVTVIVQNHLTLTQVRGGTFVVNNKPCIVLTDLNKRYTTIWETLIHELHHVLFDLEAIEKKTYHINGDLDLFLIEDKAEDFAREYFCGLEKYKFIKPHINNHLIVSRYAKEWQVDPSFIYSSFRWFEDKLNGKNYYGAYTSYFPDYALAIKKLKPITWKESSLLHIAEEIKQIFEINQS